MFDWKAFIVKPFYNLTMGNLGKYSSIALIIVFFVSSFTLQFFIVTAQSNTIIVPNDYSTVTKALENAAQGDIIIVKNGIYQEDAWIINKSLTITSESLYVPQLIFHPPTYQMTIQLGRLESSRITTTEFNESITVNADNVKILGFAITNAPMQSNNSDQTGHVSVNGKQVQIINNVFGSDTMRFDLTMNGNRDIAYNNTVSKIHIGESNQTILNNKVSGSIDVLGTYNIIAGNTASTLNLVRSSVNANHNIVSNNSFKLIQLIGADYNTFINNTVITDGTQAITFGSANPVGGSYNIFAGNVIEGATLWGVLLGRGDYNVFYGNLIENNGGLGHDGYGLAIGGTHLEVNNNLFYQNIFTNNSKNFATNWEVTGSNFFDNGTVGNYWDDYLTQYPMAVQVDSSGTGNIPYPVYDNVNDNHPLINKPNTSTEISSLPNTWSSIDLSSLDVTIPAISTSSFEIPTPSPSVPEFSWLTILPILLTIPIALAIVRKRLQGNV